MSAIGQPDIRNALVIVSIDQSKPSDWITRGSLHGNKKTSVTPPDPLTLSAATPVPGGGFRQAKSLHRAIVPLLMFACWGSGIPASQAVYGQGVPMNDPPVTWNFDREEPHVPAQAECVQEDSEEPPEQTRTNYYVEARSVGTRRETEPPRFVRNLGEIDWLGGPEETWLDVGLDYRMRYEYRDDDFRRPIAVTDEPFLLRTRAYLGVKEILDPFRFAVEFEDARRYNGQFPVDNRDFNQHEIIQMISELYFEDVLGTDKLLRVQAGRMAFEYTDRRLIARNEWRNTTNNFQGLRAILGQQEDEWQLDVLALQPMILRPRQADRPDPDTGFYGLIGDWRKWSEIITLQPYYLVLDQDGKGDRIDREIHTLALRGYGIVGETGFDYDFDFAFQFGRDGDDKQRAFGVTSEIGYLFEQPWKPRVSGFIGYASGDHDPNDNVSQRFERLYGFGRPWSANDYFRWENVIAPKARLDFQPHDKVRVDAGYGVFWLASATDSWPGANLRDPTGESGTFVGHEFDARLRWTATERTDVIFGYAHFIPGGFTKRVGRSEDSDFFYVETSVRLFK